MTRIFGIVNLAPDSFSDGKITPPGDSICRARGLVGAGADVIDLGAVASNPDAAPIPVATEIERLAPLIEALVADGTAVSVDTCRPATMRDAIRRGAAYVNDISGFRSAHAIAELAGSDVTAIVMHAARLALCHDDAGRISHARAVRESVPPSAALESALRFFDERVTALLAAGIPRARIILDPGMGYFLSSDARASVELLRALPRFRQYECRLLVSVSRKSFIGAILAEEHARRTGGSAFGVSPSQANASRAVDPRPVEGRAAGTLAAELFAAATGADFVRTHDVAALCDALTMMRALGTLPRATLESEESSP